MSPFAKKSLSSITRESSRILKATFSGNPECTIIITYSPSNVADEEVVKEFYNELDVVTKYIPSHNFLGVIGDFSARLGKDIAAFTYHESTNRNGELLHNFALENNLLVTNTRFRKKEPKLWTCILPSGYKVQIDYILVRKKWQNSMMNSQAYNSFASTGSDHRIVTVRIRLSLRANSKTQPKKVKYDWSLLQKDPEIQDKYSVEVRNKYTILNDMCEDKSTTAKYGNLISANKETADKILLKLQRKRQKSSLLSCKIERARDKLKAAYERHTQIDSREIALEFEEGKRQLDKAYEEVNAEFLDKRLQEVENASLNQQHNMSWKLINDISGRKRTRSENLKGKTKEERLKGWYTHFKDLLGNPPVVNDEDEEIPQIFEDLPITCDTFDQEEYQKAKKSIKEGKSFGEVGIPPELLTKCKIDDITLEFCNKALLERQKPDQWTLLNLIPVPKSGDLSTAFNYRGICLSSLVAKTYNRMLLNRIRPHIADRLRTSQNGFRSEKVDQL